MVERPVQGPLLSRGYRCYPNPVPAAPSVNATGSSSRMVSQIVGKHPSASSTIGLTLYNIDLAIFLFLQSEMCFLFSSFSFRSVAVLPNNDLEARAAQSGTTRPSLIDPRARIFQVLWQSPTASASPGSTLSRSSLEEDACPGLSTCGKSNGRCTASIMMNCMC